MKLSCYLECPTSMNWQTFLLKSEGKPVIEFEVDMFHKIRFH